ncbi:MAG: glutamate-5-semialdehyde dehydrogenase [Acidimicrobiales bacterium]
MSDAVEHDLGLQGLRARQAVRPLARSSSKARDCALADAADLLLKGADEVLEANEIDLASARESGASGAALDRLTLTMGRIESMASGLLELRALGDPLGEVVDGWVRPNGLRVERVRVPLGVVGIIYENRPNVTSDATGLCVKSGNVAFLRGSSSAARSNAAIVSLLRRALVQAGLPEDGVQLVGDTSHEAAVAFMKLRGIIDCLIPRGSRALIDLLVEEATVPYVLDGDGNCHLYVDRSANLDMATRVLVNAKTQRPGVCNAVESLLVHRDVAEHFVPMAAAALDGVEIRGDEKVRTLVPSAVAATEEDFSTEFLSLCISVAVVDDLDAAISHIERFGSGHSEAIVTDDICASERFVREVDAAAVLVNASTRFIDGGELGLGAEVGISTQKLHSRGPMGLRELTCAKWVVRGEGQVRS